MTDSLSLVSRGAEAELRAGKMLGFSVMVKQRVPKKYRHPTLDEKLRKERLTREARMLHAVKKIGILAPVLYGVSLSDGSLYLENIPGKTLKQSLLEETKKETQKKWCIELGKMIAQLHAHDLIHGDLTTSNVMVCSTKEHAGELFLIDFGLADHSHKLEDKAVDLVNLKKTYTGTHVNFLEGWNFIQEGYLANGGSKVVLKHVETVEKRIRYA